MNYERMKKIQEELSDETSPLGKMISQAAIRRSSIRIQKAITDALIARGDAVPLQSNYEASFGQKYCPN